VRLHRDFVDQDPLPPALLTFLRAFIQGSLEPAVVRVQRGLKPGEVPVLVATSGTAITLAALAAAQEERPPLRLQGFMVFVLTTGSTSVNLYSAAVISRENP